MTATTPTSFVDHDLQRVREALERIGEGDNPLLVETIRHLFGTRGKYIRPTLALLAGRVFQPVGELDPRLIDFGAAMEVVHTASLVHDDTLDDAGTRRGATTVNAGWNGHIAILLGDYLFAQSAFLIASIGELRLMAMLADTIKSLVRGELLQMETAFDWDQAEDVYLAKIGNKTASLLALCTEGAGALYGADAAQLEALKTYGYKLGLAFQVVDDILDLTEDDETLGKPAGSDLAQGTITLPVIYYLRLATPKQRALVLDGQHVEECVASIAASPAIEQARSYAESLVDDALTQLSVLPDGEFRGALRDIAYFSVHRDR